MTGCLAYVFFLLIRAFYTCVHSFVTFTVCGIENPLEEIKRQLPNISRHGEAPSKARIYLLVSFPQAPRGLSAEEKRIKLLEIFHETVGALGEGPL